MASVWIFLSHISAYMSLGLGLALLAYKRHYVPKQFIAVAAFGFVAVLYYLLFFVTLGNLTLGVWTSNLINLVGWGLAVYGLLHIRRLLHNKTVLVCIVLPLSLILLLTTFYSLLLTRCMLIVPTSRKNDNSTYCYIHGLPGDNALPFMYAKNVIQNKDDALISDWKLVDRPPIQIGAAISVLDYGKNPIESYQAYQLIATFLQLSWVAAVFGALITIGLKLRQAILALGILSMSGFIFINSIFVWPKFFAAGLVVMGCILLLNTAAKNYKRTVVPSLAALGLGLLIHDGVLFTIIGVVPVLAYLLLKNRSSVPWRSLLCGGLIALALLAPWFIYKGHHSSSDHLIKWHLAGVVTTDQRSTTQTIIDSYKHLTLSQWYTYKKYNLQMLVTPIETPALPAGIKALGFSGLAIRRSLSQLGWYVQQNDFYIVFFAFGLSNLGWLTWLWKRQRAAVTPLEKRLLLATAIGLAIWVLVMFLPRSTVIHQGSYATMLIIFILLTTWLARCKLLLPLFIAQATIFLTFWVVGIYAVYNMSLHNAWPTLLLGLVVSACFLGLYKVVPNLPAKFWS